VPAPRPDQELSTVYFDSEDLRLARWGLSFRYRDGQGWTVKLPSEGAGALLVRDEIVFDAGPEAPPPAAVDLVRGYLRHAELTRRVHLRRRRRRVLLQDTSGHVLADVVDDTVSVMNGRQAAGGFRELEIETTDAVPTGLLEAATVLLRDAGAGASDLTPEYVRAIGGLDAAELAAMEREAAQQARTQWPAAWKQLKAVASAN
jgi:hypothetical protein